MKASRVVIYVILAMGSVAMLFPFLWMLSSSFMAAYEVVARPPVWLPARLRWENYAEAFRIAPFGRYFINNTIIAVVGTILELTTTILAAYAFSRMNFWGKNVLFIILLGTMMVPTEVLIIQNFVTIATFNWINTFRALIVPGAASIFSIFLLRQFFLAIPIQLSYAAKVDGCRDFRFLWMIMVPLAKPALATMIVLSVIGSWNSFMWPLMVTNTPDMRTLPVGLAMFRGEAGNFYELLMAASVIVVVPMIALFLIMQKQIVNGIARSGIKG
ncbi:MAG: carbohydrate ABC transporter permease [Turicibacter sp.]|nr:carbohydrate ABC transporter permease [Turicibacter sp.]